MHFDLLILEIPGQSSGQLHDECGRACQGVGVNIALVHDWLNQLGGAEDVLGVLHQIYPGAPIFTSIYDRQRMPAAWRAWDIRSTWMDRLPAVHRHHQPYMPIFAWLWAHYRVPAEHDLILSNKSAFCIGARAARADSRHVCYCLTPTRFTFDFDAYARRERIPPGASAILRALNVYLRRWEARAAQRVDSFIAISREVQQRIRRHYGRESVIVHPPVEMPTELPASSDEGFYLIVSRLLPYKRVDLAIEAFGRLGLPLVIAGDGPLNVPLKAEARQLGLARRTHFLGWRTDVPALMAGLDVLVMPSLWEGFGLVLLEAMAQSLPIVASNVSAIPEIVVSEETGLLVPPRDPEALAGALRMLLADPALLRHMGMLGEARLEQAFGADAMIDATAALYHQIVHGEQPA